ncbi:MAG: BRCT domain-containing protein [Cellvibrionaceae bacterium]
MNIDKNGQPINKGFNYSRNIERAAFGLKGILLGIVADQKLNEQELLFLDVWLRSEEHLKKDGDVVDLLDLIGDIIQDGIITSEELRELNDLVDDVINYKELDANSNEGQINELIGFLSGMIADNKIKDLEIEALSEWLVNNQDIKDIWPADIVIERLEAILADGIITKEEKSDLLESIKQITGVRFDESGIAHGMATEFFEDSVEGVRHDGSCFCFTGTFVSGTRKVVESRAKNKGASTKKGVSKSVQYLVIGTLASRDWRFSSHGRKIEKALTLKKEGHPIKIITERTWIKYR